MPRRSLARLVNKNKNPWKGKERITKRKVCTKECHEKRAQMSVQRVKTIHSITTFMK
jgi:hypothetical protein